MSVPLVSVIIPVYNVELFLRTCIDSIVAQTYSNLEIILVDDGSPDKCPEICNEYAKRDERVKVIHQKNGGLSAARNAGIDIARGEYLTFIDGDDFVVSNYIELLYKGIVEFDADISIASFYSFVNENELNVLCNELPFAEITKEECFKRYGSLKAELSMPFISACNKIYRKDLFDSIRFPVGKLYEDAFITYKLLDKAKKIVIAPIQLYFYRLNPQSILGQSFREKNLEMVEAFRSGMDYFYHKGEVAIAEMFLPPLLMREIYCWWGAKIILKNKDLSKKVLDTYRKDCKKIKIMKKQGVLWGLVFKIIACCPWLYTFYRGATRNHLGDR